MVTFIGEYNCKIDPKGRLMLPMAFKKQMQGSNQDRFVIKKDVYVNCLVLYPYDEWQKQCEKLNSKDEGADRDMDRFVRLFTRGAAEVMLDANNRMLVPKRLLEQIKADKEVVLAGQFGKIEVWSREDYDNQDIDEDEFARLADKVIKGRTGETKK